MTPKTMPPSSDVEVAAPAELGQDGVSVVRWFLLFALYLVALGAFAQDLLGQLGRPWGDLFAHPAQFILPWQQGLKLLIFTLYLSVCCTFLPLPTTPLVVAIAMREVSLTGELWSTTLLVALAGGLGSMMANLTDYHLFTLMLRSRRVAKVRSTRLFQIAERWFARAPFSLLVVFNIVPIPVDVVRLLATSSRYPRGPFALANFLGRFVRYGLLAGLTFAFNWGKGAVLVALALVAVLALLRAGYGAMRRMIGRRGAGQAPQA